MPTWLALLIVTSPLLATLAMLALKAIDHARQGDWVYVIICALVLFAGLWGWAIISLSDD